MDNFKRIKTLKILNRIQDPTLRTVYFLAGQFNINVTSMYHILRELRDTGFIREVKGDRGKITYELTDGGKEFLKPIEDNTNKLNQIDKEDEQVFDKLGL
jgi:DNA-binding PadR family transcriptional regulator